MLYAGFVACNEFETPEQTNEDPAGETTFFVKYSIAPPESEEQTARWNLPYDEAGTIILVINSDEELKKYVEGNYPPVDFYVNNLLWNATAIFTDD